jgi:hypothetical protein
MVNDIERYAGDGFDHHTDETESEDHQRKAGLIKGIKLSFGNDGNWKPPELADTVSPIPLIAMDNRRVVQKWEDRKPVETIILGPGERYPDVDAWNQQVPREKWVEGPVKGVLVGPWQPQQMMYFIVPDTLEQLTYPTFTVGGNIAIGQLIEKIRTARRFKGPHVHPIVVLSKAHMNTRFGGRDRPHFIVLGWRDLGGLDKGSGPALPKPDPTAVTAIEGPKEAKQFISASQPTTLDVAPAQRNVDRVLEVKPVPPAAQQPSVKVGGIFEKLGEVGYPSLSQELNDDVPFN